MVFHRVLSTLGDMANSTMTSIRRWQIPRRKRILLSFGAFMGYVAYDYAAWKFSKFVQIHDMVEEIHKGRLAPVPNTYYVLERKETVDFVDKVLRSSTKVAVPSAGKASSTDGGLFKLLVGPLGCGKSWCVTTAINRNPKGIMYVDASTISTLAKDLGEAAGMTFQETPSIFQTIRSYTAPIHRDPIMFKMPQEKDWKKLEYVIKEIERIAPYYIKRYKEIPTIVIDAADTVAKGDSVMFDVLIRGCKRLANNKVINVLLVSSEGNVVPAIRDMSEGTRKVVYHLPDISIEEATRLLMMHGEENPLAEKIARISDGRLIFLKQIMNLLEETNISCLSDDEKVNAVEKHIEEIVEDHLKTSGLRTGNEYLKEKEAILGIIAKNSMKRQELLYCFSNGDFMQARVETAIDALLKGNFLVLREGNSLTFQTQAHKKYWEQKWPKQMTNEVRQ